MTAGSLNLLIPFYLLGGLSVSSVVMGVMVAIFAGARIFMGPIGGFIVDRFGTRFPVMGGLGVMAVGLVLLSQFASGAPLWLVAVFFMVIGMGTSVVDVANTSAIIGTAHSSRLGIVAATIPALALIAASIGATLGGAIFNTRERAHFQTLVDGGLQTSVALSQSTSAAFGEIALVMSGVAVLGAIVGWFRGKT